MLSQLRKYLTLRMRDGIKIIVPGNLDTITSYVLLEQEDWFEEEMSLIRRLAHPGMKAIDIGANFGVYSLVLAARIGQQGKLWSFEPSTNTASCLRRSIAVNGFDNTELLQLGLSACSGQVSFSNSPHPELNAINGAAEGEPHEQIEVITLDEGLARYAWKDIEFIKIDAENEEANIIRGGKKFFTSLSPLCMVEYKNGTTINSEIFSEFSRLGYQFYRFVPGLNLLAPVNLSEPQSCGLLNIFCCKDDRAKALKAQGLMSHISADTGMPGKDIVCEMTISDEQLFRNFPHREMMWPRWQAMSDAQDQCGKDYRQGLRAYLHAQADDIESDKRLHYLLQASHDVNASLQARASIERRCSLARIYTELGWREQAFNCLSHIQEEISNGKGMDISEPFLPASARYDDLPPDQASLLPWIISSVVTQYIKLVNVSSFYWLSLDERILSQCMSLVDFVNSQGCTHVGLLRIARLIRLRMGVIKKIHPDARLLKVSREHLNADIWQQLAT